jgi:hypothetical protein
MGTWPIEAVIFFENCVNSEKIYTYSDSIYEKSASLESLWSLAQIVQLRYRDMYYQNSRAPNGKTFEHSAYKLELWIG